VAESPDGPRLAARPSTEPSPGASRVCAWCDVEIQRAEDPGPASSHGICDPCLRRVGERLAHQEIADPRSLVEASYDDEDDVE